MKVSRRIFLLPVVFIGCSNDLPAPHGLVSVLSAPADGVEARKAGCFSAGSASGAGFGKLTAELGGFSKYLEDRSLVWIAEAYGYDGPGTPFALRFLPGQDDGVNAVGLREEMYHRHTLTGELPSEMSDVLLPEDHWIEVGADRFFLAPLEIYPGWSLALRLDAATFSGKAIADENGLGLSGVLSGYISEETLTTEVRRFTETCPADLCARASETFGDATAIGQGLLEIAGGFDARLAGVSPGICEGEACNAISVCLILEAQPIEIFTPG